jgi:hypothetical protein
LQNARAERIAAEDEVAVDKFLAEVRTPVEEKNPKKRGARSLRSRAAVSSR